MIIALLFIVGFMISVYYNANVSDDNIHEPPSEENNFDTLPGRKNRKAPKTRQYEESIEEFSLGSGVDDEDPVISYEKFCKECKNIDFLKSFEEAIRKSFREKKRVYTSRFKSIHSEISIRKGKGGFGNSEHDIISGRLRGRMNQISSILLTIDSRLKDLNTDKVSENLNKALHDPTHGIDSIVGRDDVKDFLSLQLYTFAKNPKIFFTNFQNIRIYGGSGIGKTKLAETIAFVYSVSGILIRGKFRATTKQDYTTAYINESGNLTRDLLDDTLEGILFMDEAYGITPPPSVMGLSNKDHGDEAITEIVNFTDKNVGLSVIIVAGYEKEMEERFMKANEGIPRRFPHLLRLSNYSSQQLTDLLFNFIAAAAPEIEVTPELANYTHSHIAFLLRKYNKIFDKQAGDMFNLSNNFTRVLYGSFDLRWKNNPETVEDINVNKKLITKSFNEYLKPKSISIFPSK